MIILVGKHPLTQIRYAGFSHEKLEELAMWRWSIPIRARCRSHDFLPRTSVSLFLHKTAASQLGEPKVWVKNLPMSAASVPASTCQHCRMGKKRSCCLHWSWRTEQGLKVHVALVLDRVFWLHPHASGSTISWNPCHLVHWNWWHAERSSPGNHWWRPHGSLTWHWHTSASPAGGEPGPSGIIGTNISAIGVTVCQRLWHPKLLTFVNKLYHRC